MLKRMSIFYLCLVMMVLSACGGTGSKDKSNGDLDKYVEFRAVTGYCNGEKYTVELPYLIGEEDNVIVRHENSIIDQFAEEIRKSTKDVGYKVEASCVLTEGPLVSIRLRGYYDKSSGGYGDIWATNYNASDNTASSVAGEFPYSDNHEAWLQSYVRKSVEGPADRKVRIYNFRVPYRYYTDNDLLTAAVRFTQLNDGGEIWERVMEIDVNEGPSPYFEDVELKSIGELAFEPDGLPALNDTDRVNDEYGITVTYWDSIRNKYDSRLFALNQGKPSFPEAFNKLDLAVTFEDGDKFAGDYTKVYTFSDSLGRKNFVLKTQYWGEKDWNAGIERICYVGADFIDGSIVGTIRGPGAMDERELLIRYPHDLFAAKQVNPKAHFALNMSKPTKAYIYEDPNDLKGKDLVFIVKNGYVVSIDTAASYEYSRYDRAFELSKPVSVRNNKASELEVRTALSYIGTFDVQQVLYDYPDAELLTGNDRMIRVDIDVPEVSPGVPCSKEINKMISDYSSYMIEMAKRLNTGDTGVLAEGDLIGFASLDYDVYTYKKAAALVIESKGYIFQGGGGNAYLIIYYDCDTGNIMTVREYLIKCGISEQTVLGKCAASKYVPSIPGSDAVKTAYDVKFAVDETGEVILYTEMSD